MLLGGGAVLWTPRVFGQESAISSRAPWVFPHVRPWPPHHPHPPMPRPWRSPVEVERIGVKVSVARQVAVTTMTIRLRNPSGTPQEGQAILPVPHGAMLKSFSMEGGGRKVTAELLPRDEARRIYDSIVARLRDPALLEFAGLAAVKSSLFPVPPNGTVRLRMVYEELLESEGGKIDYALPRSESLDSSMDGLIDQAKTQLWKIVNAFIGAKQNGQTPFVEVALYEYGNDRLNPETQWIRQVQPLSRDLDKISEELFALKTNGGTECCGAVIARATGDLAWDPSPNVYKAIFIAGNEPFTQGSVAPSKACREAIAKDLSIEERDKKIEELRTRRTEIQKKILELNKQRARFVAEKLKNSGNDSGDTLDAAITRTVREQAEKMGYEFE